MEAGGDLGLEVQRGETRPGWTKTGIRSLRSGNWGLLGKENGTRNHDWRRDRAEGVMAGGKWEEESVPKRRLSRESLTIPLPSAHMEKVLCICITTIT